MFSSIDRSELAIISCENRLAHRADVTESDTDC